MPEHPYTNNAPSIGAVGRTKGSVQKATWEHHSPNAMVIHHFFNQAIDPGTVLSSAAGCSRPGPDQEGVGPTGDPAPACCMARGMVEVARGEAQGSRVAVMGPRAGEQASAASRTAGGMSKCRGGLLRLQSQSNAW